MNRYVLPALMLFLATVSADTEAAQPKECPPELAADAPVVDHPGARHGPAVRGRLVPEHDRLVRRGAVLLADDALAIVGEGQAAGRVDDRQADVVSDAKILADGGMKFVSHSEEAGEAYRKLADDAAWARMKERMGDAGAERYKMLRKYYALED